MADTTNAPLYAPLIPSLAAAYQYDPRRMLVESMLAQGQKAVQAPAYNPFEALAHALTEGIGGMSSAYLSNQYQDMNKQALSDFQNAEQAGAGTPATVDASGQTVPATPPSPQAVMAKLSQSPVWAPLVAQQTMAAAAKQLEPYSLSPGQQRFGPNGPIASNTTPLTDVGKLMAARDALAQNDPNRAVYDAQIAKIGQENGFAFSRNADGQMVMAPIAHGPADTGYVGQKAAAEANARNQSDLNYKPAIEGGIAAAKAPYQVVTVRPGGAALPASSVLGLPLATTQGSAGATSTAEPGHLFDNVRLSAPPTIGANTSGALPSPPPEKPPVPGYVGSNLLTKTQPNAAPSSTAAPAPGNAGASSGVGLEHLAGGGVSIPNPEIVSPLIHNDATEVAKDREAALGAQKDQATLQAINDLMPRVQTGWGAETKMEAGRILKALGVPDEKIQQFMSTDVAQTQALNKLFTQNSAAAVRSMGAREPGSVIKLFSGAYQNLGTDPAAVKLMTEVQYFNALRLNKLASAKTAYLNSSVNDYQRKGEYRGLTGFNEQFAKTDPPEFYLHAAEAAAGTPNGWAKVKDPAQQQAIIDLIPSGTSYLAPDGQMRVKR